MLPAYMRGIRQIQRNRVQTCACAMYRIRGRGAFMRQRHYILHRRPGSSPLSRKRSPRVFLLFCYSCDNELFFFALIHRIGYITTPNLLRILSKDIFYIVTRGGALKNVSGKRRRGKGAHGRGKRDWDYRATIAMRHYYAAARIHG